MNLMKAIAFAGALMLAACSTVPTTTPTLDEARADFVAANNNPQVATYAPMEFKQASEALDRANEAAAKRESLDTIDRLAYVAKQRIATAQEVAKTKSAEAEVANASRARDRVQLEARTAEADRAKRDAETAQAQAATAQQQAQSAQAQAAAAQQQAAQQAERAARLEALLVELHAQKTERGMVVTIGDVLFATDRAELNANGMATVRKLAEIMMQNPDRTVMVEGFTDSTGSAAHNKDLSERRAARGGIVTPAFDSTISTRRFSWRFAAVSFDATGNASP